MTRLSSWRKETRTVWYTEPYGSLKIQVQVKDPDEDTTYQNYLQERKDRVEFLRKSGMPFSKAYKETVCYLWEMGENKLAQDKCETVLMPGLMNK